MLKKIESFNNPLNHINGVYYVHDVLNKVIAYNTTNEHPNNEHILV